MRTTNLLDQVAQVVREDALEERALLDERWDHLATGTAGEAEIDELLGLADASGEAFEAYQAFRPLGPTFEKKVVAAILAQQDLEREVRAAEVEARELTPPRARPWYWGSMASAVSALFLLAMGLTLFLSSVKPLPDFLFDRLQGLQENRSEPADIPSGIPRFVAGNVLTLLAGATVEPGEELEARLLLDFGDGRLRPSGVDPTIGAEGTRVRFTATLGENLELPAGFSNLVVVISRPGKFPDDTTILKAIPSGGDRGTERYWQVLVQRVELEEE